MKKVGSRRWRADVADKMGPHLLTALDSGDEQVPAGMLYVGIEFLCKRGHAAEVVGMFGRNTFDGADEKIWMRAPGGQKPEEKDRPPGQEKYLMICTALLPNGRRCGHEKQVSHARMVAALDALYAPGLRRVAARFI